MKKAEISVNTIVIIACALIILVVLVAIFTGWLSSGNETNITLEPEDLTIKQIVPDVRCDYEAKKLGIVGEYYCEVENGELLLYATPNENNKIRLVKSYER